MKCSSRKVAGGVATNSIGWGILLLSLMMLILLVILRNENILPISDLYLWILIFVILIGGILAIIGSSITKSCVVGNFTELLEEDKYFDED